MDTKILDEPFERPKAGTDFRLLISLILLWLGMVWTFLSFGNVYLFAAILTIVSTVCFFFNQKFTFWLIVAILGLGVLGFIYIFPSHIFIRILFVEFDILCVFALIGTLLINREKYSIPALSIKRPPAEMSRSKINTFKARFQRKSNEELVAVTDNSELLKEAQMAAKEILQERSIEEE